MTSLIELYAIICNLLLLEKCFVFELYNLFCRFERHPQCSNIAHLLRPSSPSRPNTGDTQGHLAEMPWESERLLSIPSKLAHKSRSGKLQATLSRGQLCVMLNYILNIVKRKMKKDVLLFFYWIYWIYCSYFLSDGRRRRLMRLHSLPWRRASREAFWRRWKLSTSTEQPKLWGNSLTKRAQNRSRWGESNWIKSFRWLH